MHTHDPEPFLRATAHLWAAADAASEALTPPKPKPMPITTAVCTLHVLAALLAVPAAGIVIASSGAPGDICAVLGALIASVLTLIEARKKDRSVSHTISVFLGAASMGSLLPGIAASLAVMLGWLSEQTIDRLTWHAWSFAGLVGGMNGWWFLHLINARLQRRAEKYFDSTRED